jgi:hypothetical protein
MNPEIKAKWVAALRSGEYKQGRSKLRDEHDNYCCLGVLCDLAAKHGVGMWKLTDQADYTFNVGRDLSATSLPKAVREWAGTNTNHGDVVLPQTSRTCTAITCIGLNDTGATFPLIADLIETYL